MSTPKLRSGRYDCLFLQATIFPASGYYSIKITLVIFLYVHVLDLMFLLLAVDGTKQMMYEEYSVV